MLNKVIYSGGGKTTARHRVADRPFLCILHKALHGQVWTECDDQAIHIGIQGA